MNRTDREVVQDALDHLAVIHRHLDRGDIDDQIVADAISLRLAALIEAISQGTDGLRHRLFAGEWHVAWATRNRIVHGYAFVDHRTIKATVEGDLPELEALLNAQGERLLRLPLAD